MKVLRLPALALLAPALAQVQVTTVTDAAAPVAGATIDRVVPGALPGTGVDGLVIPQLPGWPKIVGGNQTFAPQRGLVFEDLDGDGVPEVIFSSTNGLLYAWDLAGSDMPGFPLQLAQYPQYAPSVADLEGDGDLEIVQFTRGVTSGGRFYIVDHQGSILPGFPKSVGNNNLEGSPTLVDLDDDGTLEIVVPERAYPIGYLHVFEPDGTEWGGNWPVQLDHVPTGSAGAADLDGDGALELVYMSYDSIFAFEADGLPMAGWPVTIGNGNHHSYASPAFADLDGDLDLEVVVGSHQGTSGYFAYHHDGTPVAGWPRPVGTWTYAAPSIVDVDGDGAVEVVGMREGTVSGTSTQLYVWRGNGSFFPGFPFASMAGGFGGGGSGPVTAADVDGDGRVELFSDRSILENGQGYVWGLDDDGALLPGFPLRPEGFTYFNGANIADLDGDGDFELGVVSRRDQSVWVNLYDLDGNHEPRDLAWESYHVNARRGGDRDGRDALHVRGLWASGNTVDVQVLGAPGDGVVLATSFTTGLLPIQGDWWYLGSPFRRLVSGTPVPASGQFDLPIALPGLTGTTLHLQAARIVGGASVELTNLISVTVR